MMVKKFLKGFIAAALAVTMAVTPVSSVKAAPETMPDGMIFDAEYYAQTYPDVANAVGTDRDALYNHYVSFGNAEGRLACAPTTTVQADKTSTEPSTQFKNPLTARTTPTQALVYADLIDSFMLTDSRPTSSGFSKYVYDAYGNLISSASMDYCICDAEGRIVACNDAGWGKYLNCAYNEQGQLIQLKHDGREIQFYYDDRGRLIKMIGTIGTHSTESILGYNEQDRIITYNYNSGMKITDYTYDEQGRLIKELTCDSTGDWSTMFRDYQYEYDASGKLVRYRYRGTEVDNRTGKQAKKPYEATGEYSYN